MEQVLTIEIVIMSALIFIAIFTAIRCIYTHYFMKSCKCHRMNTIEHIEEISSNRKVINENYFKIVKKYPGIEIMVECNGKQLYSSLYC